MVTEIEADDELPVEDPVGPEVPGYDLIGILGEGAAGVVWVATEREPPRREVALKILRPELMSGDAGVRFEAEMAALSLMDHPGIARVHRSGTTVDGRPFFAMEHINGAPISELCKARELGLRERLQLFRSLCDAVAHAHRRGIIHRDLKPSNVLVALGSEAGEPSYKPKVIDFGIAKATENLLTEQTLLTQANVLMGTPAYMSPEQAAMRGDAVDTRSDIYSLGVLLYELITGNTPFGATKSASLPYDEILRRIRSDDPPRPSAALRKDAGRAGRATTTDLDWIVMKALEKDPERRYGTVDAFARDIESYLRGDSVTARPPTVSYRMRKYVRKHRVPVAAAAAVALAMVAGTLVSVVLFLRAEENAGRAKHQAARAKANAKLAEQSEIRGKEIFSNNDFTQASPLLEQHNPAMAVAILTRALRTNPDNRAAATRLLYTLASENWASPLPSLPVHGHIVFGGDGSRIAVAPSSIPSGSRLNPWLKIFAVPGGAELGKCELDDDTSCLSSSPDGQILAAGSAAGTVSLWDFETGYLLHQLGDRRSDVCSQVAFSPAGDYVAAAAFGEGTAQVWQLPEGQLYAKLNMSVDGSFPTKLCFSRDGDLLAIANGMQLRVFNLHTGKTISKKMEHDGEIIGTGFLPGGELVSWSRDTTARVWDVEAGEATRTLTHAQPISAGAISPDGSRLLTGTAGGRGGSGSAQLWDLTRGRAIGKTVRHPGNVGSVAFSADGVKAVSGSAIKELGDGAVNVFDAWTGELLSAPIFHPRGAILVAIDPDATHLAISSRHLQTAIWQLQQSAMRPLRLAHPNSVWRAVFDDSDGCKTILTLTYGGVARRWDAKTGKALSAPETAGPVAVAAYAARGDDSLRQGFLARRTAVVNDVLAPRFREGGARAAAASDDGLLLATGCDDGKVRLWSLESGDPAMPPLEFGSGVAVNAVAFDAAARRLVAGGSDGRMKLWDLETGAMLGSVEAHQATVNVVAFSPGGEVIASGALDGVARLWWPGREPQLSPVLDNVSQVNHLAFNPEGNVLAVSGTDNAARLWEVASGNPMLRPMRHIDSATYGNFLLWSPDGTRLVTAGSHDNTARAWDVLTGSMISKPMEQPDAATSAALRPDGQALLSSASSSRVWDLASGEPLTPLLAHDMKATSAAFDASGRRFVTGTLAGSAYLWDLPLPQQALPTQFLDLAEAVGGFRFNAASVPEQVPGVSTAALREAVLAQTGSGSVSAWIRWFVAAAHERKLSPETEVTLDQFTDRLVDENTPGSLREALHRRPSDPEIMARLGSKLATRRNPSTGEKLFGKYLVDRAALSMPSSDLVRFARAEVLLADEVSEHEGILAAMRAVVDAPVNPEAWLLVAGAMGERHCHYGEALAYEQARHLAKTSTRDATADRAQSARDSVRRQFHALQHAAFDDLVADGRSRARALTDIFRALVSDDPTAAVQRAARQLAERPTGSPDWATLGEVALLVSQLKSTTGDDEASARYLRAGCAALACGSACGSRQRALAILLATGGDHSAPAFSPWIESASTGWAYLDGAGARTPPEDWMQPDFDAAAWPEGETPFGYGDGHHATTIDFGDDPDEKVISSYFRKRFDVPENLAPERLKLSLQRDDGAIVYLNGTEVYRSNMPGGPITPQTLASEAVGGEAEKRFFETMIPADALTAGRNVIAVEVHQVNPQSSDLNFDLEMGPGYRPLAEQLADFSNREAVETLGVGELASLWVGSRGAIDRSEFASARVLLLAASKLAPENLDVAVRLGYVHFRLNELELAEKVFARGVAEAAKQGKKHALLEQNLRTVRSQLGKAE